ncbi:MAG: TrkA family potassium uptake protein [Planctomycetota bacterium]
MNRYLVIGLGNFGSAVCEALYGRGHDVIAVDLAEDAVDRVAQHATRTAVADGTDPAVLTRLGGEKADAGIVGTGDDISASILAALALKDVGCTNIVVKVISPAHDRIMRKLGVSETVFPERDTAQNLVARLVGSSLLNYVKLGQDFGLQEMAVPDKWENVTLRDLDLRRKHGVLVVGIHDVLTDKVQSPDPDRVLTDSDSLLISGRLADLEKLASIK